MEAPEQAQGRESGPAVDVFSWGATVAFAATGRMPFGEGRPEAVVYRVVHEEPDLDGIDPRLAPHVKAALAKEASARPSADQLLVGVIKTAMAGEPLPPASLDGATEVLQRTWVQPPPEDPKPRRGRQLAVVLGALAVIAAFIGGVLDVANGEHKSFGPGAPQGEGCRRNNDNFGQHNDYSGCAEPNRRRHCVVAGCRLSHLVRTRTCARSPTAAEHPECLCAQGSGGPT